MTTVEVLGQTYNLSPENAIRVQHWCHRYRLENTNNSGRKNFSVPAPIESMPEEALKTPAVEEASIPTPRRRAARRPPRTATESSGSDVE